MEHVHLNTAANKCQSVKKKKKKQTESNSLGLGCHKLMKPIL